jgi:predicted outer membrane protein
LSVSLVTIVALGTRASAQGASGAALGEAQLYSLYAKRHANTVQFAELAVTRGADGQVRKAAESLARAHREAREKLEKVAAERHLTLALPERDTSTALLAGATAALLGKTGRAFDSTWAHLANDWLVTLLLDNNTHVKPLVSAPQLERITREHTTWLFHQSVELANLKKKFS